MLTWPHWCGAGDAATADSCIEMRHVLHWSVHIGDVWVGAEGGQRISALHAAHGPSQQWVTTKILQYQDVLDTADGLVLTGGVAQNAKLNYHISQRLQVWQHAQFALWTEMTSCTGLSKKKEGIQRLNTDCHRRLRLFKILMARGSMDRFTVDCHNTTLHS